MSLANKIMLNASAMAGGRLITAAMGIVSVGISTRYLGLGGYAALATAIAFAAVVNTLTDIGIWGIAVREMAKRPGEREAILGATLTVGLVLSTVAVVIGTAAVFVIYGGGDDSQIRKGVLLLLVTVPLAAPYGAISAYFLSLQQAWIGMLGAVIGGAVSLAAVALAVAFDWGFTGVVLAFVAASVTQAAVLAAFAAGKVRIRPSADLALSRQLFTWAVPLGVAVLVHSLYWRIDIIILSRIASDTDVALYGLAYRVVDVLVVLPAFVTVTLLPEFARLAEQRDQFRAIMGKALAVMQVAALAVLVLFTVFAAELTEIVGGPSFRAAAPVLQVLMIGVALTYFSGVLAQGYVAHNRQKRLLVLTVTLLPVNVALNFLLIPPLGASGAALAFALSEVLHLAILLALYRGFAERPRPVRLVHMTAAAACMAAVGLVKLTPGVSDLHPAVILIVGAPLSIAVYVGALYFFRAMPREIHSGLVLPLWSRVRPGAGTL